MSAETRRQCVSRLSRHRVAHLLHRPDPVIVHHPVPLLKHQTILQLVPRHPPVDPPADMEERLELDLTDGLDDHCGFRIRQGPLDHFAPHELAHDEGVFRFWFNYGPAGVNVAGTCQRLQDRTRFGLVADYSCSLRKERNIRDTNLAAQEWPIERMSPVVGVWLIVFFVTPAPLIC